MNSFKWVREALAYEIKRQTKLLENGKDMVQETRLWDEKKLITNSMRTKEGASDYRYFPDPDLTPFVFSQSYINKLKAQLPESPKQKTEKFENKYKLSHKEVQLLIDNRDLSLLFEECVKLECDSKKIFNWLSGPILAYSNDRNIPVSQLNLDPEQLAKLINYIDAGKLSNIAAKEVLTSSLEQKNTIDEIIEEKGLSQVSDKSELEGLVVQVIKQNPKPVQDFLSGNENAVKFLVGQTMKLSKGKANPKVVKDILIGRLKK